MRNGHADAVGGIGAVGRPAPRVQAVAQLENAVLTRSIVCNTLIVVSQSIIVEPLLTNQDRVGIVGTVGEGGGKFQFIDVVCPGAIAGPGDLINIIGYAVWLITTLAPVVVEAVAVGVGRLDRVRGEGIGGVGDSEVTGWADILGPV